MRDKILVIGGASMDFTMQVRKLPAAGESTTEDNRFGYAAGGSGALAALTLARLGGNAVFVGRVGSDVHGNRLLRVYSDAGLDTTCVTVDRRFPTAMRVIMQEDNGNSRAVCYPGANAGIGAAEIERAIENSNPHAIYMQLDLPMDALIGASRMAESYNIPLYGDAGGISPDFPVSSLAPFEVFAADDKEMQLLTGTFPIGTDSCLKAAVELEKKIKAKYYLIKLGERGIFIYDGRYCHMIPGFGVRMPEGKSLCEAITAAILLEYRAGGNIQAACRFGLGLNALLLKNAADPAYYPSAEEIRAFAEKH